VHIIHNHVGHLFVGIAADELARAVCHFSVEDVENYLPDLRKKAENKQLSDDQILALTPLSYWTNKARRRYLPPDDFANELVKWVTYWEKHGFDPSSQTDLFTKDIDDVITNQLKHIRQGRLSGRTMMHDDMMAV
jgi:hypothetical protein